MADGTLTITLSPDTVYATKKNIKFPGTSAQATASGTAADTRIEDAFDSRGPLVVSGVTVTAAS